jgi:hypothetical protein
MIKEVAETQYGENADFYDGFFVPERAAGPICKPHQRRI